MTAEELLHEVYMFLVKRHFVVGDKASILDMVKRYQQPPLTMLHQVCMQLTLQDYNDFDALMQKVLAHFDKSEPVEEVKNEPEPI